MAGNPDDRRRTGVWSGAVWILKLAFVVAAVPFLVQQLPGTRAASVLAFERPEGVGDPESRSTPDESIVLDWQALAGLNYETGEMTDVLEAANGETVRVPGFIVPLEDSMDKVSEFLLVPFMGACIHVPPPPPNQLVYVRMAEDRDVKMTWWEPIWMEGRLQVETVNSAYGAVGFQMEGLKVEPYEY